MKENIKRFDYLDELRGFAVLLVVLGHLYLPYTTEGSLHPVARAIYSFHMPLFFFISGYLCELTNRINSIGYIGFLKKKSIALGFPYLFWLIPGSVMFTHVHIDDWNGLLQRFMFFPNRNIWFLPVLFIMMALYSFQHYILRKADSLRGRLVFLLVPSLLLIFIGVIYRSFFAFVYVIYLCSFFGGCFLQKSSDLLNCITNKKIMGGGFFILLILWYFFPVPSNHKAIISVINLFVNAICAVCAIIAFYNYFYMNCIPVLIKKLLQEFGKMSLVIYLLPIDFLTKGFIFHGYSNTTINTSILVLGLLQCVVACVIGRIVFKIPYLRLIMFGKIN